MIIEALKWLSEQGEPKLIEGLEPVRYTRPVHTDPGFSRGSSLSFSTLNGIVGYANAGHDDVDSAALFFLVNSPTSASLFLEADAGEEVQRYLVAEAKGWSFKMTDGQHMSVEVAQIALRSQFVRTETRDELIKTLGLISSEEVKTSEDDGFSQEVTVRDGIRLAKGKMDPVVSLIPYRSFREVEQVESELLVRLHKNYDDDIEVSLTEADGGAWRIEAQARIAAWLNDHTEIPVYG